MTTISTQCRCGHVAAAHEHFRAGDDCGNCRCGRFVGVGKSDASPITGLATILLTAFTSSLKVSPRRP
jgi:hypothetical protein